MFEEFEKVNNSVSEKERFRVAANKLLNQCFLLKKKEDTRKDYIYVRENKELFKMYFDMIGYSIRINEDQGVIALSSDYDTGRMLFNKMESIFLLIIRLLYIEKRKEISSSYEEVIVLMEEIREKYSLLKIKNKPNMDKGTEKGMVSLFRRYNIIRNIDSDVNQADCRLIIYPSVLMALTVDDINDFYEMTEKKLRSYARYNGKNDGSDNNGVIDEEN